MNAEKFLDLLPLSRYTTRKHMALLAFPPSNRCETPFPSTRAIRLAEISSRIISS
jgi:hypothetical protein